MKYKKLHVNTGVKLVNFKPIWFFHQDFLYNAKKKGIDGRSSNFKVFIFLSCTVPLFCCFLVFNSSVYKRKHVIQKKLFYDLFQLCLR